ncbi:MAG: hypothetical protein ACJA01_002934 [Saprospiraceae bacterium]|jgi:hypothetical protein
MTSDVFFLVLILLVSLFFIGKFWLKNSVSRKTMDNYNKARISIRSSAIRFGYNPESGITRNRIEESYLLYKQKVIDGNTSNFENLFDLDQVYNELLEQAAVRAKFMSKIPGYKSEFGD